MKKTSAIFLALFLWIFLHSYAQPPQKEVRQSSPDLPLSITRHQITVNGKPLFYTATAGYTVVRDEEGKAKANIFFITYTKDNVNDPATRPLTFSFNGGPGSSSVWLHMGALGPRRVLMTDLGEALRPPYKVVDNEFTWLDETDLVFIDPVMTGYSRPAEGVDKKEFTGYEEDIRSIGEFIRLYSSRAGRWSSPKFIVGESYGTTRAAGLSGYLQDRHGLYLNGIVLISAILNFQTAVFESGNDLPFGLFLPTYTAMAWYHKKLSPEFTALKPLLEEVQQFAMNEYSLALAKGDRLTDTERKGIIDKLNRYTSLSKEYLDRSNLRIYANRFTKELLRAEKKTVGRLDGRFTGVDYDYVGETNEYDPSYNTAIYGPYTAAINDYLKRELQYSNDLAYEILTSRVWPWNYNNVQNKYLNVAEILRQAMSKNPYLKVHICNGYYDMATPYFATDYTVNHLFLDKTLRPNISQTFYEAGHMMYIHKPSMIQLRKDISVFFRSALP
ncbi:MAG: peptidase S10 [Bacteroidota bacterium]